MTSEQYINEARDKENYFFTDKYGEHCNNGLCPCCNEKTETVEHLFTECKHPKIQEIRDVIDGDIYSKLKQRFRDGISVAMVPKPFY